MSVLHTFLLVEKRLNPSLEQTSFLLVIGGSLNDHGCLPRARSGLHWTMNPIPLRPPCCLDRFFREKAPHFTNSLK